MDLEVIGSHLREARKQRGVSLREMARRIGVSPSFVSEVELGRATPAVGTLYAFVSELGLSLDELMADGGPNGVVVAAPAAALSAALLATAVQRADTRQRLQVSGAAWERLTSGDDPLVDFLHVTYSPGGESCPADQLMHHGGREYGFVVSGRVHVQVAFDEHTLEPGDSISFDSMTPHRLSNPFTEVSVSVWLVVGRRDGCTGL